MKARIADKKLYQLSSRLLLGVFAGIMLLGSLAPQAALALSNISPDPSSVSSGGTQGAVGHLLKYETVANISTLRLGVYYPVGHGGSGAGEEFRIRYGNVSGKKCYITQAIINGGGHIRITLDGEGSNAVYKVPIGRVCNNLRNSNGDVRSNVQGNNSGWQNNKFFANYKFPARMKNDRVDSGMYKLDVTIEYVNVNQGGSMENNVNFITSVSQGNALVGTLGREPSNAFGMRSEYIGEEASRPSDVRATTQFGIPCNVDSSDFTVKFFDPDQPVFGNMWMWVTENGNKLPFGRYQNPVRAEWSSSMQAWRVLSTSNEASTVGVNGAEKGRKYKFAYRNDVTPGYATPNGNVMSFGLPYDSIYAEKDCEYDLKSPLVITSGSRYAYYPNVGLRANIDVEKGNDVTVFGEHRWQVYAVRYSQEPSTRNLANVGGAGNPCNNHIPQGNKGGCGSIMDIDYPSSPTPQNLTYNSGGPDPVGTHLCFFARVQNPTESNEDNEVWRYSNMVCALSGLLPKIQVWGGDTKVTNSIQTSIHNMNNGQNRRYGSWGEYGVFSQGVNSYMSSGAGLTTAPSNSTQNSWSSLTFSNTGGSFGNFNASLTPPQLSTDGATATHTNKTVSSLADLLPAGRTHATVVVTDTLTINNDLIYRETANSIRDLQKVVIHARNIRIGPDVTRIDPWLVAENISTCSSISGFRAMTDSELLSANLCRTRLKFNGPVMANNIYLYRTYDDMEGKAAETFNLRADSFLSSYTGSAGISNPVARTSSVTELPPRF